MSNPKTRECISKIKTKSAWSWLRKITLGTFAIAALSAAYLYQAPITQHAKSAASIVPRFNYQQNDAEMLRGANLSGGDWADPVSANIGDRVAVLFYYHNGVVDSVAHHTKLRVDLPMNQTNQLVLTSYLWSQETAAISDTIVDGQIVGHTGLTINLPSNGRVEYVPGSTLWYPNRATVGTNVPDGIVSASGLDIGDIQGCWQYSGYVKFYVDIRGQAQLVMDKKVAHPGDPTWQDEISAIAGEQVVYSVGISNQGNITASTVLVKDILPLYMTYITGSTMLFTPGHPEGIPQSDAIFTTAGLALPDILPGTTNAIYLTYKTSISANIPNESCGIILNNVAKVFMGGVEQATDQARVTVICQSKVLFMDKKVKAADGSWVEQNTANLNDTVYYQIVVRNDGNVALSNVTVRDVLPLYINYIPGSTKIDGVVTNDLLITTAGINLGTFSPTLQKTITFSARVYGCPPADEYNLANTAYAKATGVVEFWNNATTVVNVSFPGDPTA